MIELLDVLGPVAEAKLAGDRAVNDVIQYLRAATLRATSGATASFSSSGDETAAARALLRRRRRRMRDGSAFSSRSVRNLSDEELEKVLSERRRERERYTRALRKDKLGRLETELENLRRDIGKMEATALVSDSSTSLHTPRPQRLSQRGTPGRADLHPVDPAQPKRGSLVSHGITLSRQRQAPDIPHVSVPDSMQPIPPPPPPPLLIEIGEDHDEDDEGDYYGAVDKADVSGPLPLFDDVEKRKKEKDERQRRREEKRKEREAAQKKLTLADIIRGAGPDPIRLLKPMTPKPADAAEMEWEKAKLERERREAEQEAIRIEQERLAKELPGHSPLPVNKSVPKSSGENTYDSPEDMSQTNDQERTERGAATLGIASNISIGTSENAKCEAKVVSSYADLRADITIPQEEGKVDLAVGSIPVCAGSKMDPRGGQVDAKVVHAPLMQSKDEKVAPNIISSSDVLQPDNSSPRLVDLVGQMDRFLLQQSGRPSVSATPPTAASMVVLDVPVGETSEIAQ